MSSAVTQISKVQIKRGPKESLPEQLSEGEFGMTTDSGELFVGAPNLPAIAYRQPSGNGNSVYPYRNLKILTELDLYKTLDDYVYTTGPLLRVIVSKSVPDTVNAVFSYSGPAIATDTNGDSVQRIFTLVSNSGDLRGKVVEKVRYVRASDGQEFPVPDVAYTLNYNAGSSINSSLTVDIDQIPITTFKEDDTVYIDFYDSADVIEYDLDENDAFVIDYSMKSTFDDPSGLIPKRIGNLQIIADQYSVFIQETGITMNNQPNVNYMDVRFAGVIQNNKVVLRCTNLSHHPVAITFNGTRWLSA